jgi:hypothetical protein
MCGSASIPTSRPKVHSASLQVETIPLLIRSQKSGNYDIVAPFIDAFARSFRVAALTGLIRESVLLQETDDFFPFGFTVPVRVALLSSGEVDFRRRTGFAAGTG